MNGFEPERYERELTQIINEIRELPRHDERAVVRVLRRHPRDAAGLFSRSQLIAGFRHFADANGWGEEDDFVARMRTHRVRTLSGVAPVTVLTKPFPCPGRCVFCPSDVRMPKSYLSLEPSAQRAAAQRFDPYRQTLVRLRAYRATGHATDKVELIVLGGTWSHYPESYRIWFVKRCLDALNDFGTPAEPPPGPHAAAPLVASVGPGSESYNAVVSAQLRARLGGRLLAREEAASPGALVGAQTKNESAASRAVGLSVETRPDCVTPEEARALRRLGVTKVQLGLQSLSDAVLRANRRGHSVADSRRAVRLLRAAGFKIQAHWMPNLLGSSPEADRADFARLFADPDFRPDELKIYPCVLVESAELVAHYRDSSWRPYPDEELVELLADMLAQTPRYCRLSRVIRDISSTDIVAGNRAANLRQVVEARLRRCSRPMLEIRSREIRDEAADASRASLVEHAYRTSIGREWFVEAVDARDRLLGFVRLSLPSGASFVEEIDGSALIRELHVYGTLTPLGQRGSRSAQHRGLGRRLVRRAAERARAEGYADLAVISAVGTRRYYDALGFCRGALYQHLGLAQRSRV